MSLLQQGYPDFSQPNEWTSRPFISESATLLADKVYPVQFVGNFSALAVLAYGLDTTTGWQLTFEWFTDATATTIMDAFVLHAPLGANIRAVIPNRGAFVRITLSAQTYVPARAYTLIVWPRGGTISGASPVGSGTIVTENGLNVAAGAFHQLNAYLTTFTKAVLAVQAGQPNWTVTAFGMLFDGSFSTLLACLSNTSTAGGTTELMVPGMALVLFVNNNAASNTSFNIGVTAVQ